MYENVTPDSESECGCLSLSLVDVGCPLPDYYYLETSLEVTYPIH